MRRVARTTLGLLAAASIALAAPTASARKCGNGRSADGAMWLSIGHPGLGEWHLKGWGAFEKAPQKKFWLGFIPLFGWPGYLQVKSAIDASKCKTNDELWFRNTEGEQ